MTGPLVMLWATGSSCYASDIASQRLCCILCVSVDVCDVCLSEREKARKEMLIDVEWAQHKSDRAWRNSFPRKAYRVFPFPSFSFIFFLPFPSFASFLFFPSLLSLFLTLFFSPYPFPALPSSPFLSFFPSPLPSFPFLSFPFSFVLSSSFFSYSFHLSAPKSREYVPPQVLDDKSAKGLVFYAHGGACGCWLYPVFVGLKLLVTHVVPLSGFQGKIIIKDERS